MLPAAGAVPHMVLWLTLAFVAFGLVLLVVLAPSGRGRAARAVVVAGLLAMGLAIFTNSRKSASERAQSRLGPSPQAPIALAVPEPPEPPVDAPRPDDDEEPADEPASADEESVAITGELPKVPAFAKEWLNSTGSPVRFEGSKLVIGGHAVTIETAVSSQPGKKVGRDRAAEVEVRATVRRDAAERLSEYFQKLVDEPPPPVPRLNELRTTLQRLSAEQRARIAEQAARLRTVIARHTPETAEESGTDSVEFYAPDIEITHNQIRDLVRAEIARARRGGEVSTPAKVFGTVGVLVAAAIALKAATRRHTGLIPGR